MYNHTVPETEIDLSLFITVIDAAGKLGSGILDGNLNWPGSYDECINTQAVVYANKSWPSYPFSGKYCMVGIQIRSPNIPQLAGGPPTLSLGICVPESCNNNDAEALVRKAFTFLSPNLTSQIDPVINCHKRDLEFDCRAIAVSNLQPDIDGFLTLQ
ncbi:hypothetical protein CHS0354_031713 [Potamilus streckersoni]|uniref:Nose resistant-to-fluoxetine protein N-terminal domain-containing protein n=1 Tax=Potamilus streckersoni TaxID=2493646 RepID=A0AAE0WBD1_9BIVA|nr:hypothetical protein CHS0354_031713 [Potamilus streckersoni]